MVKKELVAYKNPKSPISEIFRTVRTNLKFINSHDKVKSLLITSALPEEGKTWVASNLAITFAQAGNKVVLVDADIRKGRLASLFQIDRAPGLSNFLSGVDDIGQAGIPDILAYTVPTEINNLFIIPSGNIPPNPAELLSSDEAIIMMESLKENFDIIILDGTPGLLVTDSLILSKLVDSTLIVTKYNSTKKDDLEKLKKSIENIGGKISGVIVNNIPVKAKEYNSKYYYKSKRVSTSEENIAALMAKEYDLKNKKDF